MDGSFVAGFLAGGITLRTIGLLVGAIAMAVLIREPRQ